MTSNEKNKYACLTRVLKIIFILSAWHAEAKRKVFSVDNVDMFIIRNEL